MTNMDNAEFGRLLCNELLKICHHETWSEEEKTIVLYRRMQIFFQWATRDEKIPLTTPYARMAFVCHRYKVPQVTQRRLFEWNYQMRQVLYQNKKSTQPLFYLALDAFSAVVAVILNVDIPAAIKALLPEGDFYPLTKIEAVAQLQTLRVVVLEDVPAEKVFLCRAVDIVTEGLLRVSYDTTNQHLINTAKTLRSNLPAQARLHDIVIDAEGVAYPERVILEPDYLISVTDVAEAFQGGDKKMMWNYLLKRFLPPENTPAIMVGNIANLMLDELINDPKKPFEEIFGQVFQQQPISLSMLNDEEVKEIFQKSKRHYNHIKQSVEHIFPDNDIDTKGCILEPTFFSEGYGLQGRLDVWFHIENNIQQSAIVELKSGKPYMANKYNIGASHYIQALLYDLLIKSVYQSGEEPRNFILYSGEGDNHLRYAPDNVVLQDDALAVRNVLTWTDWELCKLYDDNAGKSSILDHLQLEKLGSLSGFNLTNAQYFQAIFKQANSLEKAYFYGFVGFIAREQRYAKVGSLNNEHKNGMAGLWLLETEEKHDNYSMLSGLEVEQNGSGEVVPMVIFIKNKNNRNALANIRVGDIAILYAVSEKNNSALHTQLYKCTITELSERTVSVRLRARQRNFEEFDKKGISWQIESDIMDTSFTHLYRNLLSFIHASKEKRNLLLGLSMPETIILDTLPNYPAMLPEQALILEKMLRAKDYFLLWGPPGTGKTSTMLRYFVQYHLENTNDTLLLLAFTNKAVDEICESIERINETVREQYFRIGSKHSTPAVFHDILLESKLAGARKRDDVKQLIKRHRIVVATVAAVSMKPELFKLKQFDCAIIDEASQLSEPMLCGLLPKVGKFILIGDHLQLPAVVVQTEQESRTKTELLQGIGLTNLRNSMFERLYKHAKKQNWTAAFDILKYQGRMHEDIMQFPKQYFYNNQLEILPAHLETGKRQAAGLVYMEKNENDLAHQVLGQRVSFIHQEQSVMDYSTKTNLVEAKKIVELITIFYQKYTENGEVLQADMIGVITPYRAQIACIKDELAKSEANIYAHLITVDTVERYQGGARNVILISLCVNSLYQLDSILSMTEDDGKWVDRKLNVAMTRAKDYLVLVGNKDILGENLIYKNLIRELG